MPSSKPTIGFCGLGAMGFGMATNLVKQGYTVTGFDVFSKSVARFKDAGGVPASSLQQSAEGNAYYVCMVATAQQAQSAIFDDEKAIIKGLPQHGTLLLCSTVPATYAQFVAKQLIAIGRSDVSFIDCPVSGGAVRAANGTLTIMAGASPEAIAEGKWLLEEMAGPEKLFIVNGGVGQGSNMKMVHQVLAAVQILSASEGMGLALRMGLDPTLVREKILESEAWSWMFENRTTRMLTEDYFPGVSALTIILKDVSIITSQARTVQFPTHLCSIAEQVYFTGVHLGYGPDDDAGMLRLFCSTPIPKSTESTLSEDEIARRLQIVTNLLSSIHLMGAAEAFAFADHFKIPLDQFYGLAVDAAGGSRMFSEIGPLMIRGLKQADASLWLSVRNRDLSAIINDLSEAVAIAQELKVPSFLGTGTLNLLLAAKGAAGGSVGEAAALKAFAN